MSLAIKAIKGEPVHPDVGEVILLDDGTTAELDGPSSKHDAYIFFESVGCKEAVPIMIKALAEYEKAAAGREPMICTSLHLKEALVAQTGEDFGYSLAAWQKWWDAKGNNMPDWFFKSNVLKRKKLNSERSATQKPTPDAG